jgi:hypothetical protein
MKIRSLNLPDPATGLFRPVAGQVFICRLFQREVNQSNRLVGGDNNLDIVFIGGFILLGTVFCLVTLSVTDYVASSDRESLGTVWTEDMRWFLVMCLL